MTMPAETASESAVVGDDNMRRVIVVGCGYVGGALAARLVAMGHDVVGTTTRTERISEIESFGARGEVVDIADAARLRSLCTDRDTAILTVAAGRSRQDYAEVYEVAARNLVAAAENSTIRRIVYTSSTGVYAQDDGSWVDEDFEVTPTSDNGRVLVETERILLTGARRLNIDASVIRLGGIYGPGRDPAHRIRALAGTEQSGGEAYINLVHLDDIVEFMVSLMEVSHHGTLNLVDDEPTTRREYYDAMLAAEMLPGDALEPIRWTISHGSELRGKRVRNDRIRELLGMRLKHPKHL